MKQLKTIKNKIFYKLSSENRFFSAYRSNCRIFKATCMSIGQIAGCDIPVEICVNNNLFISLLCSLKRSRALLGSNSVRNRAVYTRLHNAWADGASYLIRPFNILCKRFCQCQEKPTNESLAILLVHATMIVEVLLQISKSPLYFVVRIWHISAIVPLKRK